MFLDSSMVEHSAVNRRVVGSSPTRGVIKETSFVRQDRRGFFGMTGMPPVCGESTPQLFVLFLVILDAFRCMFSITSNYVAFSG